MLGAWIFRVKERDEPGGKVLVNQKARRHSGS
jgi:hypothetical protein